MLELKTVAVLESGAYSALLWNGLPFAVGLEHTFEGGRTVLKNGSYVCKRDRYHKGGYETFEIQVHGHDRVLFHKGNKEEDSRGCVLVAESFVGLEINDSKGGFGELMKLTEGIDEFELVVSGR